MINQKQFGVWMDTHHAAVIGSKTEGGTLTFLAHVDGENTRDNPNDQVKFFKEIASHMVNATHVHVTGTGQAQEQFIHYLSATPQFKDVKTEESTSNKMSDERLVEYITAKF